MVMSMYCIYFFLPLYSMLRGSSALSAGLHLTPFPIGISVGSLSAGLIMNRTGRYYTLGLCCMALFNLATALFCAFSLTTPDPPQYLAQFLFGAGYGAQLTVGLTALIAAVKHSEQATTTSTSYLFRATGGTIGAAVGSAVFQGSLRRGLARRLGASDAAREVIERVLRDFEEVARVPEVWRGAVETAYMEALRGVFVTGCALGLLGLAAAAMMREHTLHARLDRK
jgi:MFS family permease